MLTYDIPNNKTRNLTRNDNLRYILTNHVVTGNNLRHHILQVVFMHNIKNTDRALRISLVTLTNNLSLCPGTDILIQGGGCARYVQPRGRIVREAIIIKTWY